MKKKFLFSLFALMALAVIMVLGVSNNLNNKKMNMSDVMLSNLEALADPDEGNNCPGGSCEASNGTEKCSACCPEGKSPFCNQFGCECR